MAKPTIRISLDPMASLAIAMRLADTEHLPTDPAASRDLQAWWTEFLQSYGKAGGPRSDQWGLLPYASFESLLFRGGDVPPDQGERVGSVGKKIREAATGFAPAIGPSMVVEIMVSVPTSMIKSAE